MPCQSNYPVASSSITYKNRREVWTIDYGKRAENSDYYKSATSASELEKIFEEISGSIIQTGYPTEVHGGYGEHKSGYSTFTDELGDFMQVDNFTSVVYNGETSAKPAIKTEGKCRHLYIYWCRRELGYHRSACRRGRPSDRRYRNG